MIVNRSDCPDIIFTYYALAVELSSIKEKEETRARVDELEGQITLKRSMSMFCNYASANWIEGKEEKKMIIGPTSIAARDMIEK